MTTEPQLPRAARIFVAFVPLLRVNGFAVAPEQTTTFLAAIELLGPRDIEHVRQAALATLAPPPERRATFDRLFDLHFRGSEAITRDDEGEDDETVRLQEEGRGDEEPLLPKRRASPASPRRVPRPWSNAALRRPRAQTPCAA